uniref:Putative ovule protein n=1 Tax=Solanum chacoense TaxID=4108 RepID=A0A0V0HI94_SOLCH
MCVWNLLLHAEAIYRILFLSTCPNLVVMGPTYEGYNFATLQSNDFLQQQFLNPKLVGVDYMNPQNIEG